MSAERQAEKGKLRASLRQVWGSIASDELARISADACRRILNLPEWVGAKAVMVYLPMPGEVDVSALAESILTRKAVLTAPRVDMTARSMCPVRLDRWPVPQSPAESKSSGMVVPLPPENGPEFPIGQLDLVIVPGRAFDAAGNRLGRGAGFYDRFLLDTRFRAHAIGIAPDCVILERVPTGAMDASVEIVVTESRVIRSLPR